VSCLFGREERMVYLQEDSCGRFEVTLPTKRKNKSAGDVNDKDVCTHISHPGKTMNDAICHGTIHIPPKDVITHLSFFKWSKRKREEANRGLT
jgi:hypothetical protein